MHPRQGLTVSQMERDSPPASCTNLSLPLQHSGPLPSTSFQLPEDGRSQTHLPSMPIHNSALTWGTEPPLYCLGVHSFHPGVLVVVERGGRRRPGVFPSPLPVLTFLSLEAPPTLPPTPFIREGPSTHLLCARFLPAGSLIPSSSKTRHGTWRVCWPDSL